MSKVEKNYICAKEAFADYGIDTDQAIERMSDLPVSVHCWQIDDLTGFENPDMKLSGGIAAFGSAPGKPRNREEFIEHLDKAFSFIPGKKKLALHSIYSYPQTGEIKSRDCLEPEDFEFWVNYAQERQIGLDFNPTYFSHEMADSGFTLSSSDESVRKFWIEHGKRCRKIGEYFGKSLNQPCITNHWIPDGYKDCAIDKLGPRMRLKESLDEIFSESINQEYNIDSLESKLFGLGSESYVTGSHEFYSNYVADNKNCILCMDTGHYHPTEVVSSKISSYLVFNQKLLLHISRPVRWDSDHVVLLDDETQSIMKEVARHNAFDRVFIGLDFFDASINRVTATVIGACNVKKAMLLAFLEPSEQLMKMELEGDFSNRLLLSEEVKKLPFGFVWDMYCEISGVNPTAYSELSINNAKK